MVSWWSSNTSFGAKLMGWRTNEWMVHDSRSTAWVPMHPRALMEPSAKSRHQKATSTAVSAQMLADHQAEPEEETLQDLGQDGIAGRTADPGGSRFGQGQCLPCLRCLPGTVN